MSTLWTSQEAEAATLGKATKSFEVGGISIDTRTIQPGDLFIALKGDSRDGHDFVQAALDKKAGAALVSKTDGFAREAVLLAVANTQRGLEDLARASRARSKARIVGVTGSAGKTTTKEILRVALGALGTTHCSAASYNNHWGVPLSLASMPRGVEYGVFEIGMNHFGEIRALVGMVRPHVALITTIAPAHLEFFGTSTAIADAKSEIFEGIAPGGAGLVPADNEHAERLIARAKQAGVSQILSFGEKGKDARLTAYRGADESCEVEAEILGKPVKFTLNAPGRHIAGNAVGALLAVAMLDGDVLNAAAAMKNFAALKGRGARFSAGGIDVIDESYNANPASMAAALALLGQARGRRIAVLGDMLEMGEDAKAHHAALAKPLDAAKADLVFVCGTSMEALWDALPASRRGAYAKTSAELKPLLLSSLKKGDTVLVKGSFGSRMAVIIEALAANTGA